MHEQMSLFIQLFLIYVCVNTLRPRQNGRHFPDDVFKCIFLNENVWIPIDVQATSHYLNQWWLDYRCIYASLGLNELNLNDPNWVRPELQVTAWPTPYLTTNIRQATVASNSLVWGVGWGGGHLLQTLSHLERKEREFRNHISLMSKKHYLCSWRVIIDDCIMLVLVELYKYWLPWRCYLVEVTFTSSSDCLFQYVNGIINPTHV